MAKSRRGLGKGRGKGYRNMIGKDPVVHSQSAKGMKQPEKIRHIPSSNIIKQNLIKETVKGLDNFEDITYNQYIKQGKSPEEALKILVNTVEGDTSQLSPALKEYAEKKGLLNGFRDSDGDGVVDSRDCQPSNPYKQGKKVSITVNGKKLTIDYVKGGNGIMGIAYYGGKPLKDEYGDIFEFNWDDDIDCLFGYLEKKIKNKTPSKPKLHVGKQKWKEFNKSDFREEINRYTNQLTGFDFNNDFFARWWFEAFPENRDPSYMKEWVERFRRGDPVLLMDKERRDAYFKVTNEWRK